MAAQPVGRETAGPGRSPLVAPQETQPHHKEEVLGAVEELGGECQPVTKSLVQP